MTELEHMEPDFDLADYPMEGEPSHTRARISTYEPPVQPSAPPAGECGAIRIEDNKVHFCPSLCFATGRLLARPILCTADGNSRGEHAFYTARPDSRGSVEAEAFDPSIPPAVYLDNAGGRVDIAASTLVQLCTEKCIFIENRSSNVEKLFDVSNNIQLSSARTSGEDCFLIRGIFFAQRHALLIGTVQKWRYSKLVINTGGLKSLSSEKLKAAYKSPETQMPTAATIREDQRGIRDHPNGCDFIFPGDILLMVERVQSGDRKIIFVTAGNNSANVVFQLYLRDFLTDQIAFSGLSETWHSPEHRKTTVRPSGPNVLYPVDHVVNAQDMSLFSIITNFFWWFANAELTSGHILEMFPDPIWVSLTVPDYRRRVQWQANYDASGKPLNATLTRADGEVGAGIHFYNLAAMGREAASVNRPGVVLRLMSGLKSHGNVEMFMKANAFSIEDMLAFVRMYSPTELYANDLYGFFNFMDKDHVQGNYYTKKYMENLQSVGVQYPVHRQVRDSDGRVRDVIDTEVAVPYDDRSKWMGVYPRMRTGRKVNQDRNKKTYSAWYENEAVAFDTINPVRDASHFHSHANNPNWYKTTGQIGPGENNMAMAAMPDFYLSGPLDIDAASIYDMPAQLPDYVLPSPSSSSQYDSPPPFSPGIPGHIESPGLAFLGGGSAPGNSPLEEKQFPGL